MKTRLTIAAGLLAALSMPLATQAQGIIGGGERGAAEGGRAAGPVGAAVGGVVGGVTGGVVGGARGVLGVPRHHHYGYYHHYHHRHYHKPTPVFRKALLKPLKAPDKTVSSSGNR